MACIFTCASIWITLFHHHGIPMNEEKEMCIYVLSIKEKKFTSINFFSFAEILSGGVKISNNPKLCNMDTVLWDDIIDISKKPRLLLDSPSNLTNCKSE